RRLARSIVRRPADTPSPSPFPLEGKGRPVMTLIENFPTHDAWAEAAAARLAEALAAAIAADGRAVFAGAGGSTPSPIYARLAQADLDWAHVVATLVDERYVPETSPDSNAALMKRVLLTGRASAARFVPLY